MQRFEQAVREGNIGVDAMYGNLLTGVCRQEELLRQFTYGVALGRRCGVKVDSMMISDVPGLTWGVVPALVQNGVRYISDGPNANPRSMQGDRIGYVREQWEHRPFYWLSPSGRDKVLYWGAQGGYSIGHGWKSITTALPYLLQRLEKVKYPYDIVQMRWTKGDNGPPDEAVMDLVREWNAKYAYPRMIIATTTEAFHAFEKRYGDKLPTYRGDMTPYWEDGTASGAGDGDQPAHGGLAVSGRDALGDAQSRPISRGRLRRCMEECDALGRAYLGRVQQRQPAGAALREGAVEVQAGICAGRPAADTRTYG